MSARAFSKNDRFVVAVETVNTALRGATGTVTFVSNDGFGVSGKIDGDKSDEPVFFKATELKHLDENQKPGPRNAPR